MSELIRHQGKIIDIDRNKIYINIVSESSCASCKAKGFCTASEIKDKIIEVKKKGNENYRIGETVSICLTKNEGTKAVILGYGIPFVILIAAIAIASSFTKELYTGLIAIVSVGFYYLLLYFFRKKINNQFEFKIESFNN